MRHIIIYTIVLWQAITANAIQTGHHSSFVSDTLKQNAHSIVQEYTAEINVHSAKEGEGSYRKVITILDEDGRHNADFVWFADKFHTFNNFKGEVLDATGKRIMTIKKSDLKSSSLSEDLASDDMTYFYDCTYEIYPYTIVYEWSMKYKHGFLSFPNFSPITSFNQSLVSARYNLTVPTDMEIDFQTSHTPKPIIGEKEKSRTYQWQWKGIKALESETLGPPLARLVPKLYIKPLSFYYDKYAGRQSTWQELSAWHHSLLVGRDLLDEEQIQQIKNLVKDLDNDYDKVKRLYSHLGEKLRYVSIQLGIGGLQPMTATETMRMGFGDCKALSHYLKVMLQIIGIPSEYVIISTTNETLYANYPNVHQMNHVILKVPLKERTLWLECTNPYLPFGYIHESIAGHEALIIRPEKGSIERLPHYADSLHTQNHQIEVKLTDNSQTLVQVERISSLSQYENNLSMLRKKMDERKNSVRRNIRLNQITIGEVEVTEKADSLPSLTERYNLQGMYGNKNGNRLFVPINPFRTEPFQLSDKTRKYDIYINYGYLDNDTIKIIIPEDYQVETVPKDITLSSPCGHIKSNVKVLNNEITITQSLYIKQGVYPVTQIKEFKTFSETIKKMYNDKIILKK